eukprot:gene3816-18790_t
MAGAFEPPPDAAGDVQRAQLSSAYALRAAACGVSDGGPRPESDGGWAILAACALRHAARHQKELGEKEEKEEKDLKEERRKRRRSAAEWAARI